MNKILLLTTGVTLVSLGLTVAQPVSAFNIKEHTLPNTQQQDIAPAAALPAGVAVFTYIRNGIAIAGALANILNSANAQPATGLLPPISITFAETKNQVSLDISGGDFDVDTTQTFSILGSYWSTTFSVSQASGVLFDTLGTSGNIRHLVGPDATDGLGTAVQFRGNWSPPFNPSLAFIPANGITRHPTNQHQDRFTGSLTGTTSGIGSDIGTWSLSVNGIHEVPEPTTILGLGIAFGFGTFYKKRYSGKQNNVHTR
jgi:hypothetical protein